MDWPGTYQGVIPAADTAGIQVQLILEMDGYYTNGFFALTFEYLDGDHIPEIGQFRFSERAYGESGRFTWNEAGNTIRLDTQDWPPYYFVGENMLIHLGMELDRNVHEIIGELPHEYILLMTELPHYPAP